jgi:hypothetical protein
MQALFLLVGFCYSRRMSPEALLELIHDFETFKEEGNRLHKRLAEFSAAVSRTEPAGEAEKVLLESLKSFIEGAIIRLGSVKGAQLSGGAASAIHLALADLRKTPDFATAFAHIRRSKNLPADFGTHTSSNGNGHADAAYDDAYAAPPPKALSE